MRRVSLAAWPMFYAFCLSVSSIYAEGQERHPNIESEDRPAVVDTPPPMNADSMAPPTPSQAKFTYFEPLTNAVGNAPAGSPGDDITSIIDDLLNHSSPAPDATGFRIDKIVPGSAADRVGLRPGDVVVGAYGLRVYSCTEATVLKDVQEDRDRTDWIVQRGDVTFKVTLTDLDMDCLFGVYHATLLPFCDLARFLRENEGITPPSYHEITGGAWDSSTNNLANLRGNSAYIFNYLPARAGHAVYNLTTSRNAESLAFLRSFLEAFARLKWEDYAGARKLIQDLQGVAADQDPFLNGLLQFYDCVAEQLAHGELPTPKTCNVDVATYAVCMPVPIRYYSIRNAFPSDPVLASMMNRMVAGTDYERSYATRSSLTHTAYRELKKAYPFAESDTISGYMVQVKAALVSIHQGAYNLIYAIRPNQGPGYLRGLQERMQTADPKDAVGYAMAMLIPAISANDRSATQKSCSIIYGSGDEHTRAFADFLVLRYLNYYGWDPSLEAMARELHPIDQQPLYYRKLAEIWPWFHQRLSFEPVRCTTRLASLGPHTHVTESRLASCFARPRKPEESRGLYEGAIVSNDAGDLDRAITAASRELSWDLTDANLKRMLDLMRRVPPALAWESLSRALNERHWDFEFQSTAPATLSDYFSYFKELEREHYPSAYAALARSGHAPTAAEVAHWYQQAATPAMCRLIGDCYWQHGDMNSAKIWTRRAVCLHKTVNQRMTMRDCSYLYWKYARDMLVGPPGDMLYDEGDPMGEGALRSAMWALSKLKFDTGILLTAIMAKREGDAAEMVKQIILSTSPLYGADRDLVLYEGGLYEDGPSLRKVLVQDVLKVPGVKRKDIAALLENGIIRREIGDDAIHQLQQAAESLADEGRTRFNRE